MSCCCSDNAKSIDVLSCMSPLPATPPREGRQFNGAPSLWERELCVLLLIALPAPALDALRHNLDDEAVALCQLAFAVLDVFVFQQQQSPLMFWTAFQDARGATD